MTPSSAICFGIAILLIVTGNATNSARLARSPQFGGGFSQAQASAQSGGYGFGRPRYFGPPGPLIRPGFGQGGFGQGGFGQGGYGQGGYGQGGYGQGRFGHRGFGQRGFGQGGSISISKSVSISRGGAAQSSSQSVASGK